MKNKLLDAAIILNAAGLKVIPTNDPTRPDGKKPLVSWKQYQAGQTNKEVKLSLIRKIWAVWRYLRAPEWKRLILI